MSVFSQTNIFWDTLYLLVLLIVKHKTKFKPKSFFFTFLSFLLETVTLIEPKSNIRISEFFKNHHFDSLDYLQIVHIEICHHHQFQPLLATYQPHRNSFSLQDLQVEILIQLHLSNPII